MHILFIYYNFLILSTPNILLIVFSLYIKYWVDGPLFSYFLSVSLLPQRIRDRPTSLLPLHFIRAVGDRREPGEGGKVTKRDTGRAFSCEGPPSAQKREGRNKWLRECSFPWRSVPYGHSRLRRVYDMSDNRMAELNLGFYRHIFLHLSSASLSLSLHAVAPSGLLPTA